MELSVIDSQEYLGYTMYAEEYELQIITMIYYQILNWVNTHTMNVVDAVQQDNQFWICDLS